MSHCISINTRQKRACQSKKERSVAITLAAPNRHIGNLIVLAAALVDDVGVGLDDEALVADELPVLRLVWNELGEVAVDTPLDEERIGVTVGVTPEGAERVVVLTIPFVVEAVEELGERELVSEATG